MWVCKSDRRLNASHATSVLSWMSTPPVLHHLQGVNAANHQHSGALQFVDVPGWCDASGGSSAPTHATGSLPQLYRRILDSARLAVAAGSSDADPTSLDNGDGESCGAELVILVDCLSSLHSLGFNERSWRAFLHSLLSISTQLQAQDVRVILMVEEDIPEDADWIALLQHQTNVVLTVLPMEGRMAGIDGQVVVEQRCCGQMAHARQRQQALAGSTGGLHQDPLSRSFFFKSSDSNVKLFEQVSGRHLM
ncbi:MAG: hypothetical protein WDW36_007694 [Sanguina aurantia]